MDEFKIVAILDRSAGNESVGEMWQETKVFSNSNTLHDVLCWANQCVHPGINRHLTKDFRGNLKLTIAQ